MAPQPKALVSNPDGATCAVGSCGACKAKSWLFKLDDNDQRSWMCGGSSMSAHRTLKAKGEWTLWDGAELAPLREPDVIVVADGARDTNSPTADLAILFTSTTHPLERYATRDGDEDVQKMLPDFWYDGIKFDKEVPYYPNQYPLYDDDARAAQRAVNGLRFRVRILRRRSPSPSRRRRASGRWRSGSSRCASWSRPFTRRSARRSRR